MRLSACAPLLMLSVMLSLAACKSTPKASPPPTEGEAGKVVELKGSATASRQGDLSRDLKPNSIIYVKDKVHTEVDSSVTIRLDHNGATYSIPPKSDVAVEGSKAWNATGKTAGLFDPSGDHGGTSAAGGNTAESAADTKATAVAASPPSPESIQTVPDAGQSNQDTDKPVKTGAAVVGETGKREKRSSKSYSWPKRKKPTKSAKAKSANDDKSPGGGGGLMDNEGGFAIEGGKSTSARETRKDASTPSLKSRARVLVSKLAKTCHEQHKGSGKIRVVIQIENSKITKLTVEGPKELEETLSCLEEEIRLVEGPPKNDTWSFSIKL